MFQNIETDFEMTFLCFYLHLILATVLLMVPVPLMVPPLYIYTGHLLLHTESIYNIFIHIKNNAHC